MEENAKRTQCRKPNKKWWQRTKQIQFKFEYRHILLRFAVVHSEITIAKLPLTRVSLPKTNEMKAVSGKCIRHQPG